MKIYIQTNKATTNIFGLHTQPRKTTRYTNKLKLASGGGGGGGGEEKEPAKVQKKIRLFSSLPPFQNNEFYFCFTCYYG